MDYRFIFSSDHQTPVSASPQAIGLDLGELFPLASADGENCRVLDILPQSTDQIDPEESEDKDEGDEQSGDVNEDNSDEALGDEDGDDFNEELEEEDEDDFDEDDEEDEARWRAEIDAAIDKRMKDGGPADLWKHKVDSALNEWDVDGEDKVNDMELGDLLELISRREGQREALLRRVQSEIREELNRRGYHYIEGEMSCYSEGYRATSPTFFVPSMGCRASHFDLSIILEGRPHCCVRLKVKFPILCGPEMAPALLMRFAELNQSMRYFSWNYDFSDHSITLRETIPFWDEELSRKVMTTLMGCVVYLPLMAFPELEWLSTGIVTTKVDAEQLEQMRGFLQRLESCGPCLSPRALQRLRDGLAAVPPQENDS